MSQIAIDEKSLKDYIGHAEWITLHRYCAGYPEKPNDRDKQEFHSFFKAIIRGLPEGECQCKSHAISYVQQNPPDVSSNDALSAWMCKFHNSVNARIGKAEQDCNTVLNQYGMVCKTCNVKKVVEAVTIAADKDGPLKESMDSFKKISVKVFEELCRRENIPVPVIKFAPCPHNSASHVSCTLAYLKRYRDNIELFDEKEPPVVYLKPDNYSLRTVCHEFAHYRSIMKKEPRATLNDEAKAHKEALSIITQFFPADTADAINDLEKPLQMKAITRDSVPIESSMDGGRILHDMETKFSDPNQYPILSKYMPQQQKSEATEFQTVDNSRIEAQQGFLHYFDFMFEPIAESFHMDSRDLNKANTPQVIANAIQVAISSQLSSLGSLISTSGIGIILFIISALMKENIGIEDRRLLTLLGGNILWSGLNYINPKDSTLVINEAGILATLIQEGRFMDAVKSLIESPLQRSMKNMIIAQAEARIASTDPNAITQQEGVATRRLQRAGSGFGTGQLIGGSGGVGTAGSVEGESLARTGIGLSPGIASAPKDSDIYSQRFGVPGTGDFGGVGVGVPSNIVRSILNEQEDISLRQQQRGAPGYAPGTTTGFKPFGTPDPIQQRLGQTMQTGSAGFRISDGGSPGLTYIPNYNAFEVNTDEYEPPEDEIVLEGNARRAKQYNDYYAAMGLYSSDTMNESR